MEYVLIQWDLDDTCNASLGDFATHSGLYIEGSKEKLYLQDLLINHFFSSLWCSCHRMTQWGKKKRTAWIKVGLSLLKAGSTEKKMSGNYSLFWSEEPICFLLPSGNLFCFLSWAMSLGLTGRDTGSVLGWKVSRNNCRMLLSYPSAFVQATKDTSLNQIFILVKLRHLCWYKYCCNLNWVEIQNISWSAPYWTRFLSFCYRTKQYQFCTS